MLLDTPSTPLRLSHFIISVRPTKIVSHQICGTEAVIRSTKYYFLSQVGNMEDGRMRLMASDRFVLGKEFNSDMSCEKGTGLRIYLQAFLQPNLLYGLICISCPIRLRLLLILIYLIFLLLEV
ncbi:unnamed protein product [Cuscuta epithymum]|uniref:Uncharacterized protein n=1 Tax=Cuscuta epithymum TaxID=186058 RepID=A0AAV0G0P2_9ASTE|nr:unnamed protein product [Cuscuta epithymum]